MVGRKVHAATLMTYMQLMLSQPSYRVQRSFLVCTIIQYILIYFSHWLNTFLWCVIFKYTQILMPNLTNGLIFSRKSVFVFYFFILPLNVCVIHFLREGFLLFILTPNICLTFLVITMCGPRSRKPGPCEYKGTGSLCIRRFLNTNNKVHGKKHRCKRCIIGAPWLAESDIISRSLSHRGS